jgi:hypothetical protein
MRAISVMDLTRFENTPYHPALRLAGRYLTDEIVKVGSEMDDDAFVVSDDVTPEQWAAYLDIVRNGIGKHRGIHKNKFRIYERTSNQCPKAPGLRYSHLSKLT